MKVPAPRFTILFRVEVFRDGAVWLQHAYIADGLNIGGHGWVRRDAVFAHYSARMVQLEICLRGHANDGATGAPRLPSLDLPF